MWNVHDKFDYVLDKARNETPLLSHDVDAIAKELFSSFYTLETQDVISGISYDDIRDVFDSLFNAIVKDFEAQENQEITFEEFVTKIFDSQPCTKACMIECYHLYQNLKQE